MTDRLSPSELAKIQGAYYLAKYGHKDIFLIKACDRLDNLRSLDEATRELKETRHKYLPLFYEKAGERMVITINNLVNQLCGRYNISNKEMGDD